MAKAKKKENLTPEERLQAALVPDWEQPYKVPENWCWAYLTKGAAECLDSFRKPINASDRANREGDIPYYGATGQVGWIDNFLTNEQLVLVGEDGAPFLDLIKDKAYIIEGKAWVNNHAHILRSRYGSTGNYFLMHYLNIFNYHGFVNGTTRLKLTQGSMDTIPVPIPHLPEQQRIVDRIESLFAKLDEAKQKAQDALDSFETRKAAILLKAFTGELTAQWRKEHGVGMESWDKTILKNVCKVNPKKIDTNGLPDDLEVSFFPMASLSEIYGEITEPQTRLLKDVKNGFTNFSEGDVVFAKITPCMENGKSAIIGKLVNGIGYGTTEFYVLRCNENLYNRYLYHMVRDTSFRNKAKAVMSGAVGQQRVPKSFMENYPLNLPSVPEQTEIVRILDDFLAKEQQAKEAAEAVLEQIDLIKKSILARAFRGELGTNDPTEESAVELVKEVIERSSEINSKPKTKVKRTVIPAEIKSVLSNANEEEIVKLLMKSAPKTVSVQMVMSISKKKFELMDALRNLEQKQIIIKDSFGEYLLKG